MTNDEVLPQTWVSTWTARGRPRRLASLSAGVAFLCVLLAAGRASAAEYYVAPTGNDANPGSMAQPFASLQKGHDVAAPGDTVWLRGGKYSPTKQIKLSKSGLSDAQRIKFWAYQKEVPLIDFSGYVSTNPAADVPALLVTGNWLHLRGLEIANVPVGANGAHSISGLRSEGASNNTFELLNIHNNFGPGLFISKGTGGNLILNVDSHDNYDKNGSQGDGQNADGFGVHYQTSGPSTILRGCRAWLNSDDGYDLISQEVPVTIEDSWAVMNGYADGGTVSPAAGNGNGFKAGSSQTGIRHVLQNNVAWKNKAAGFYANHSSGGNTWLNNTSYKNGVQYNMLASPAGDTTATIILTGALAHKMRNNIGFPNKNSNMGGVDSMFNTWDLGITEAGNDFVSTVDTGYAGPRQANGSPPALNYLKLAAGSPLIDKGTNVGLPYVGAAPDLGAYEYGAVAGGSGAGGGGSTSSAASSSAASSSAASTSAASTSAASTGEGSSSVGSGGAESSSVGSGGAETSATSGNGGTIGAGGATSGMGGSVTPGSGGAAPGDGAGGDQATSGGVDEKSGCACAVGSSSRPGQMTSLLMIGAFALLSTRRRRRRA